MARGAAARDPRVLVDAVQRYLVCGTDPDKPRNQARAPARDGRSDVKPERVLKCASLRSDLAIWVAVREDRLSLCRDHGRDKLCQFAVLRKAAGKAPLSRSLFRDR
jgi:hypothetical protein